MQELFEAVDEILSITDASLADSTVVMTSPPTTHSLTIGEGVVSLVLDSDTVLGQADLTLRDASGEGLQGTIPEGVTLDIGGTLYTVKDKASASFPTVTVTVAETIQAHTEGDAVSTARASVTVYAATIGAGEFSKRWGVTDVQFCFSYHHSQTDVLPTVGWICEKTGAGGVRQVGTVTRVGMVDTRHEIGVGK